VRDPRADQASVSIVSNSLDEQGVPLLLAGSPHANGPRADWLAAAIRRDQSLVAISRAPRINRVIPPEEGYPHPESCAPYQDATGLGWIVRPRLPLLFVRTRRGELLPDARTALAYARENQDEFRSELETVARYAASVLDPSTVRRYERRAPETFSDLVQPYRSFRDGFFFIPLGIRIRSMAGLATLIGPPLNRAAHTLPILSGVVETAWYHRSLFAVTACPEFTGRTLLIMPEEDIAQLFLVGHTTVAPEAIEHSASMRPSDRSYELGWRAMSRQMARDGKGVRAPRTGVASVTMECLHCRMSVTDAAEGDLPDGHQVSQSFVRTYKAMQRRTKGEL
jgi:hypothetical protein